MQVVVLLLLILLFLTPVLNFPEERKNYAMQYKKVQKSSGGGVAQRHTITALGNPPPPFGSS